MVNLLPGTLSFLKERCFSCKWRRHARCFEVTPECPPPKLGLNVSVNLDCQGKLMRTFITASGVQVEQVRYNHCSPVVEMSVKLDAIRTHSRTSDDDQDTSTESPS